MNVYLDLNVFDDLEKKEQSSEEVKKMYDTLDRFLSDPSVNVPYSNAHLNDLIRGYKKNPSFMEGHLSTIEKYTSNLLICQYWKKPHPIWQIRPVREFFQAALKDQELILETWDDMLKHDFGLVNPIALQTSLYKFIPVPIEFKKIYQEDPIFGIIYPLTRSQMNLAALGADLYNFSVQITRDFSLYKSLRRFLLQSIQKYRLNANLVTSVNKLSPGIPDYLQIEKWFEELRPKSETGIMSSFDRFFETFFRFDISGYKSDARFPNMIDDALHTYYAAHCDVFLSKDERCRAKAIKTYERLKVSTRVYDPLAFLESIKSKT